MKKALAYLLIFLIIFPFLASKSHAVNSPEKISTTSNDQIQPAITTDSSGKVHTVWVEDLGNGTTNLLHRYWNGQVWSTPTTIASGNYHELPSLSTDASGNIHLVWDADTTPGAWRIYYSKYNGSTWSAPVAISTGNSGDVAWDSEIAIDSSSNPHVAYSFVPSGSSGQFTYYAKWNGTSWTTPIDLTESGTNHSNQAIAADKVGEVHVVWKSFVNGTHEILHRVWNGSNFSSTVSISGALTDPADPRPGITTDNANNAHVVWEERDTGTGNYNIKYSKYNGISWSSPFLVSSVAQQTFQGVPSIAVLRSSIDDVLVGWIDKTTSPRKLAFRKFNANTQSWEISRTNDIQQSSPDFPVATMDKWDNVHTAWGESSTTGKYEIYYDAIPLAINLIGSSGGTLTTFNGDTLTIPSGSLSQNTLISAQLAPLSQAAPSGSNTVSRQYIFEPSGQTFNPAISVVFKYTDAETAAFDERTLGVYVWDSTTTQWVFKTGSVNRTQNKITLSLDHFSIWGFFGTQNNIIWLSPLSENGPNEINSGKNLSIKFSFINSVANPQSTKLLIVNEPGLSVKEFNVGEGKDNLRYDSSSAKFISNLKTDSLPIGSYQAKVFYDGLVRGSIDITVK